MNRITLTTAVSALALVLSGGVFAQQYGAEQDGAAGTQQPGTEAQVGAEQLQMENRISQILDKDLENPAGENLGNVEELAIDEQGQITHVLVRSGGVLGVGGRLVAVPWEAVQDLGPDQNLVANIDQQTIDQAQEVPTDPWPADFSAFEIQAQPMDGQQPGVGPQPGTPADPATEPGPLTHPDAEPGAGGTTQPGM